MRQIREQQSGWLVIPAAVLIAIMVVAAAILLLQPDKEEPAPVIYEAPKSVLADWPQFNADAQHSSSTTLEVGINSGNVAGLHRLFQTTLPATVDSAPVYLSAINTNAGLKNLVFVTTTAGDLLALDADSGSQIWVQHNPANNCVRNKENKPCYTTAAPAIDPNRLYIYSYGLDGFIHKYNVASGIESTGNGWPELTSARTGEEKGSSALSIVETKTGQKFLYMAHAYYPDGTRRNQGHLTTVNLLNGTQHVFNNVCSDQPDIHFGQLDQPDCKSLENGIWARGPVVYSPVSDRIYFTTGCCTYDPAQHQWGQSVLALRPDGTGTGTGPLDSYTMSDWQKLDESTQLASSAPAILPVPVTSKIALLGAQAGKDGHLRLLNLADLSGQAGPGHLGGEIQSLNLPQQAQLFTQLAVWVNPVDNSTWLYATTVNNLLAFRLEIDTAGKPALLPVWQTNSGSTSSPLIVGKILFQARSGEIAAFDPTTGQQLWHDLTIGDIHWQSPIVINGVLYLPDQKNKLNAFTVKK